MLLLLLLQAASAPAASTRAASIASETTRYLDMTPPFHAFPYCPLARGASNLSANGTRVSEHDSVQSAYEAQPIDTSQVRLPADVERLIPKLAENATVCGEHCTPRQRLHRPRHVHEHFEAEHREWLRLMIDVSWH